MPRGQDHVAKITWPRVSQAPQDGGRPPPQHSPTAVSSGAAASRGVGVAWRPGLASSCVGIKGTLLPRSGPSVSSQRSVRLVATVRPSHALGSDATAPLTCTRSSGSSSSGVAAAATMKNRSVAREAPGTRGARALFSARAQRPGAYVLAASRCGVRGMRALTPLLLLTAPPATRSLTLLAPAARPHVLRAPPVAARVPKAFRGGLDLSEGSEWEGQVEEITDFGCFVRLGRLGVQRHRGLLHVSGLSEERLESAAVPDYVEETVGPVGSKVRVLVRSLEYKGRREALPCHDSLAQPAPVILSRRPVGLESRCSSSRCSRGRARASCQSGRSCGAWRRARRGAEVPMSRLHAEQRAFVGVHSHDIFIIFASLASAS